MRVAVLNTPDDLRWLDEVHVKGLVTGYVIALLYGNEDWPDTVELYRRDHYQCRPTILAPDEDGELVVTQYGETHADQAEA